MVYTAVESTKYSTLVVTGVYSRRKLFTVQLAKPVRHNITNLCLKQ